MKRTVFLMAVVAAALALVTVACSPKPSSNDIKRDQQEESLKEGAAQTGMPAIKNFRELKLAKDLYELRDQTGLVTYTYLWSEFQGKFVFLCDSIGYPLPYGVQFTQAETRQRWTLPASGDVGRTYGNDVLPQAEPNGLFVPDSVEASWVMCKSADGPDVRPVYVEPRVITSQYKLGL